MNHLFITHLFIFILMLLEKNRIEFKENQIKKKNNTIFMKETV